MTLKDSKDEFIYTIRRLPAQNTNQYEQIITKKFNENAYLDRLNRENTFWVTYNNVGPAQVLIESITILILLLKILCIWKIKELVILSK